MSPQRWKGKGRALESRDEGPGGSDGIVLSLDLVSTGSYDVAYTLPVKFSEKGQQFSLQIDTGSADLWVASTSCSTASCAQTNGRLYNPSGSKGTGKDFTIPYLQGSASGPIVWDKVTIGGYTIDNQALAAASNVQSEPLAPNFSGILGLALPLNSIIATDIPPVTSNDPDGAAWASNLFSITPTESAPAARFLSLTLARPGSDAIPSLLGIGRHPAAIVPDPSKVKYSTLVSDRSGVLFWKASVRAITVYVNGIPNKVTLGRSASGAVFPSAVLDSGVPLILTTSPIANAIYGAIGVSPASDGLYYVPCKTPLNMSITIDTRPEIPIHPLDLTTEPPQDNKADFCVGLIQAADQALSRPDSSIGDMILGVPFMRNVYTVMAYATPDTDGSFPTDTAASPAASQGTSTAGLTGNPIISHIVPRLGLMPLTDPTKAMSEFNTVRVLNQPISSSGSNSGTNSANNTKTVNIGGAKMSVGIIVLIAVMSFFVLCGILFVVRWLFSRRRYRRAQKVMNSGNDAFGVMDKKLAYRLARSGSGSLGGRAAMSEEELRQLKFNAYMRREKLVSDSTVSSERTHVDSPPHSKSTFGKEDEEELGLKPTRASDDAWDPKSPWAETTLVGTRGRILGTDAAVPLVLDQDRHTPSSSPERAVFPRHRQQYSDADTFSTIPNQHRLQGSVDVPLLSQQHTPQHSVDGPFLVPPQNGFASYRRTDEDGDVSAPLASSHGNLTPRHSPSPSLRIPPTVSRGFIQHEPDDLSELGVTGMAGVGTASRTGKISMDGPYPRPDSMMSTDTIAPRPAHVRNLTGSSGLSRQYNPAS